MPHYKVVCGRILTRDDKVVSNIRTLKPGTVCTSSWGLLFTSTSLTEVNNVKKYVQTKTFRALVRCLGEDGVIAVSPYRFSLVPIQDFTAQSDIDWYKSLTEIDQQLYQKYGLTTDEIQYIESTIKSLDTPELDNLKLDISGIQYTGQDAAAAYINQLVNNQN